MKVDCIIVGQGIAGTCFAFELLRQKKTFIIIDDFQPTSSSRIALGIYNPIVLKWFTKAWDVDNQLQHFYSFYNQISTFLKEQFIYDVGIYKFLKTAYQQNNWLTKNLSSGREDYMSSKLFSINNKGLINNKFYGLVKSSGRIDVKILLKLFRKHCIRNNKIIEEKFNYNDLSINSSSVIFRDIHADKIVFCEGYGVINNPYFNDLTLKPTKGELLIIFCKGLNLKKIIHVGLILIPLGNDYYTVGSTYDWKNINTEPTMESKKKIIEVLDNILQKPYSVVNQLAGIRPSTADRRPLVGSHKKYKSLYILNGLGTRGILSAPYLSKCLYNNMYLDIPILKEISINRL